MSNTTEPNDDQSVPQPGLRDCLRLLISRARKFSFKMDIAPGNAHRILSTRIEQVVRATKARNTSLDELSQLIADLLHVHGYREPEDQSNAALVDQNNEALQRTFATLEQAIDLLYPPDKVGVGTIIEQDADAFKLLAPV